MFKKWLTSIRPLVVRFSNSIMLISCMIEKGIPLRHYNRCHAQMTRNHLREVCRMLRQLERDGRAARALYDGRFIYATSADELPEEASVYPSRD